ncbi:MAG: 4Fe-4S dicluster domain-containing protein [Anaerolineae bacterium]
MSGTGGAVSELDPRFKEEVAAIAGELDLVYCFQCGVCSGSCPTLARMEYGPRRLLHMVHLGLADQVLRSRDIWLCVSCYSCAARCPQGIEITDVMAALRSLAIAKGLAEDKEAAFSRAFVEVVQRHGRLYEPELLLRYYASEKAIADLLKQAGLGLKMLRKGKLPLRPERIENAQELREAVARLSREEKR